MSNENNINVRRPVYVQWKTILMLEDQFMSNTKTILMLELRRPVYCIMNKDTETVYS